MFVEDEKDYIMRMIGQMVRALVSVILGKEFRMEELPDENKYEVPEAGHQRGSRTTARGLCG